MGGLRAWFQHRCNELHICCRLRDVGLPRGIAGAIGRIIGGMFKPFIYRGRG